MDETSDVWLPPWFYWSFIKIFWTQNGCGHVCVPYTLWLLVSLLKRVLSWVFLPITYSIFHSQLKYQIRKTWLKTSVLYKQLLSSAPYATLCPIQNAIFMFFVYWTIHQLIRSKINFFLQTYKASVSKTIFRDFILSANLV